MSMTAPTEANSLRTWGRMTTRSHKRHRKTSLIDFSDQKKTTTNTNAANGAGTESKRERKKQNSRNRVQDDDEPILSSCFKWRFRELWKDLSMDDGSS